MIAFVPNKFQFTADRGFMACIFTGCTGCAQVTVHNSWTAYLHHQDALRTGSNACPAPGALIQVDFRRGSGCLLVHFVHACNIPEFPHKYYDFCLIYLVYGINRPLLFPALPGPAGSHACPPCGCSLLLERFSTAAQPHHAPCRSRAQYHLGCSVVPGSQGLPGG